MFKHGSLFSGIGGFDVAAEWVGWKNVFSCEKDPFCRAILKHYWPNTKHYEDVHRFNATQYRGRIDIISGGFPCQPFSQVGQRKGKDDDRYLWPQAYRIITEARPKWIVLENVTGLFTILEPESLSEMEIKEVELFCSDNEQKTNSTIIRIQQRVIGSIISEIVSAGYILPKLQDGNPVILCIPACAVDAPHRRDRVWFVAHSRSEGLERAYAGEGARQSSRSSEIPDWSKWPTQSPVCGRNDGISGTLDGITFPKWRNESIKAYGNAIVPQIALEIFRAIEMAENGYGTV